ncbi:dTDP-4-dehydrorhamnose reductase [Desulfitobacterium metallireducens]|uniref:dTDP-4-dehydrorhamnose reductase n=1 Tax=Desulfitobacterium metallireducens DSM 15288 TaxID=871968 RepID=W0EG72_9FIRM|nr:dTDP-4-dehydrorhamnose reductase [Desulfitobacterium metallireducens]AHF08071.1 spore coat protein [Desulfitobacterium metallireducens DSM 15288]
MKVLITGASGQLGRELTIFLEQERLFEAIPLSRKELDVTDFLQVQSTLQKHRPDIIIHTAAYTQVDRAETEQDQAYAVNAMGTRNIALGAEKIGAKLVYISTDYVFDGQKIMPYIEFDKRNPQNTYGKSKAAGEEFVQAFCSQYFIVRTSWVYGNYGPNFVKTMLNLAKEKKELKVVNDQVGAPTYTLDLAYFIFEIIQTELFGIYHVTNSGECTWYELAKVIFEEMEIAIRLNPCNTEEFPRPALRPKNSVLDHMGIRLNGLTDLRPWREALAEYLKNYEK